MKKMKVVAGLVSCLVVIGLLSVESMSAQEESVIDESRFIGYEVNSNNKELAFYWKDVNGIHYKNFKQLQFALEKENKELTFAMNGGMYLKDLSPQGLYIEKGITKASIDTTREGYGNFYLQPNGVFFITKDGMAKVCTTNKYKTSQKIAYATQSGPMLLIDGDIHSKFTKGSANVHIRNGVGILPDGNILFAISKEKVNFYDFASFFKEKGCKNALYLDGFVSRVYLPTQHWEQLDGNFGVIIAESKSKK